MELAGWQRTIFVVLFIGYMSYIFDRKSFSFNLPNVKRENIDSKSIGSVHSSLAIGYGIGKFISGILVDLYSPSRMFATGLVLCGAINILFSLTHSTSFFSVLWLFNGLFQGFGWPPCGKLLRSWYSPVVFGSLWSLLSSAMNVAAAIGPFLCNSIAEHTGSWRHSMLAIGIISILLALLVLPLVPDTPEQCGLKAISHEPSSSGNRNKNKLVKTTFMDAMQRIITSPYIYVVSSGFLLILLCKASVCDWGPLYLIEEKNASKAFVSVFTGTLEMGGLIGSILSGVLGDWILSMRAGHVKGHPRNFFAIPCCAVLLSSLFYFRTFLSNVEEQYTLAIFLAFTIGFCIYSLISVLGVLTIESTAPDVSGRSHALAALCGNIGLTMGGLPFSMLIEYFSWNSAFFTIECCILFLICTMIASQGMRCRIGDTKKQD